jgi:FKBP-type peptidyl-prolyl cis-trans isomerase FkpA
MKVTNVAGALCFALVLGACNNVDFKKTKGGMPYKVYASKSGAEIEPGNFVKVHLIQKIKDSVTYNTNTDSTMPLYMPVSPTGNPYDFSEVLPSLKVGDSLYTVQVMDTFIARNPQMIPPQFKKGDKIETSIKILQVYKTQEEVQQDEAKERNMAFDRDKNVQEQLQKDLAILSNYLSQNGIQAQKTGKGTHVQILEPGNGMQAAEGKYVSLKYSHTEPLVFQVGAPGMIRGFDEGVRILKEGAKAKIYIPSVLAYGPQSPSPEIKPYENLIFDIEVLKVSDQPLQQQMGPQANVDSAHAH